MKILTSEKLQRFKQKLQKKLSPKALILMYHRVVKIDLDPWSLSVTPQHFIEHLEVLHQQTQPISLQKLIKAYQEKNIPHRAVAITFDDGYVDNLDHAKPLMEGYDIPATVFISTGYLKEEREFWWDELEQLLLRPGKLPEKLTLNIDNSIHYWELGSAVDYSQEDYRRDHISKAWQAKPGSRMSFYYLIWQVLQPLLQSQRIKALEDLANWTNTQCTMRQTHRSLFPEEIYTLGQGELVEIGAHTVTHPFLSAQSTELQQVEIQQSKADLEKIIHRPVTSFSYPFGDRTQETMKLAHLSGFDCACSTIQDAVWQQSNVFDLPRYTVQNWNKEEFQARLLEWFHG